LDAGHGCCPPLPAEWAQGAYGSHTGRLPIGYKYSPRGCGPTDSLSNPGKSDLAFFLRQMIATVPLARLRNVQDRWLPCEWTFGHGVMQQSILEHDCPRRELVSVPNQGGTSPRTPIHPIRRSQFPDGSRSREPDAIQTERVSSRLMSAFVRPWPW
jgi:hypothetical protein